MRRVTRSLVVPNEMNAFFQAVFSDRLRSKSG